MSSILGDVDDALSGALAFVLRPIRSWVRKPLHIIVGWALNVFHLVGRGWDDMVHGGSALVHGLASFPGATYRGFFHVLHVTIPNLAHWAAGKLHDLGVSLAHEALRLGKDIVHAVTKAWNDLQDFGDWLSSHIIAPILHRLGAAEHYLSHAVHDAVELVLHPGRLFEWLWNAGLSGAVELTHDLAPPTLRWFKNTAAKDTVQAAHALEAVLTAML